jgi:hypothetical protein
MGFEGDKRTIKLAQHIKTEHKDKLKKRRMPTTAEIERIWDDWEKYTEEEFAKQLDLNVGTVKRVVALSRKLVFIPEAQHYPSLMCPKKGCLRDLVGCAAAKRGMILEK